MSPGIKDNDFEIACAGECLIEISMVNPGELKQGFAGDTLNTCIYLKRLLKSSIKNIYYLTALGEDPFSEQMILEWQGEGLNTDYVKTISEKLPGLYYIMLDDKGDRRFYYWRKNSAARELLKNNYASKISEVIPAPDIFYFSGITLAILPAAERNEFYKLLKHYHENGVKIIFDSNYREQLWRSPEETKMCFENIYPTVNIALVSFYDENAVYSDASPRATCDRLAAAGISEIIVKNGPSPCTVYCDNRISSFNFNKKNNITDTTAAGDSFNAGFISARLLGHDIETAVKAGQRIAGIVIEHPGAIIPPDKTPCLEELI